MALAVQALLLMPGTCSSSKASSNLIPDEASALGCSGQVVSARDRGAVTAAQGGKELMRCRCDEEPQTQFPFGDIIVAIESAGGSIPAPPIPAPYL